MFEGFVGCFSYLEHFMKTDNLRAVHVEAATVPDACSYQSKCGAWPPHCHQILLRPMCGKYFPHIHVPSIYLNYFYPGRCPGLVAFWPFRPSVGYMRIIIIVKNKHFVIM